MSKDLGVKPYIFPQPVLIVASYKLRRKTHRLACGMKAAFSIQNYIAA
ncbi:MAG: hypothetical protein U0K57_03505 [Lachnospiraceae bacterium]|nr:hypothetical protein [Lachnospiraceae bacterium]